MQPARSLQLRRAPVRAQAAPRRQDRLHRRPRHAHAMASSMTACARLAAGLRAAGPAARRARAAADARQQRLAGGLPRLPVCRRGAGGGQHAADGRRLRLHAGAQRAPRPRWCRARCCRRCSGAMTRSDHEVAKVIVSRPVAPLHPAEVDFEAALQAASPLAAPRAHRRRRPALLALLVRLHRPAPRARCTRMPTRGGRPSCTASRCWG